MRRLVRYFDRYPFNSPWIRTLIARYWLVTWFAAHSIAGVANAAVDTRYLFFDARLYLAATRSWLAGGNPWDVQLGGNYFAAPPPSLLPLVPFALLPGDLGLVLLVLAVFGGALATIRLLRLPWWWLLFPPLVQCLISGNVQTLLVPLILVGGGTLAVLFKIYAAVPLVILGRWWALLLAALILAATALVLPWAQYLGDLATINGRLVAQTKHYIPIEVVVVLAPLILAALAVVGRERAAWLAPLALWPAPQYYYGTFAMPLRSDIGAALVAFPVPGSGLLALSVLAALEWRNGRRIPWPHWLRRRGPRGVA